MRALAEAESEKRLYGIWHSTNILEVIWIGVRGRGFNFIHTYLYTQ